MHHILLTKPGVTLPYSNSIPTGHGSDLTSVAGHHEDGVAGPNSLRPRDER